LANPKLRDKSIIPTAELILQEIEPVASADKAGKMQHTQALIGYCMNIRGRTEITEVPPLRITIEVADILNPIYYNLVVRFTI
jgi:hypothetical protein